MHHYFLILIHNTQYLKKGFSRLCDSTSWLQFAADLISHNLRQAFYKGDHWSIRSWALEEGVDDKEAAHDPRRREAKLPPLGESVLPRVSLNLKQKWSSD